MVMMPKTFFHRVVSVFSVLFVVCFLAACSGIPRSGVVHEEKIEEGKGATDLVLLPDGPVRDANQTQILMGFLQAVASPKNDYAVARQFLSRSFVRQWEPNTGVVIDSGQRVSTVISDTAMNLTITPQAELNKAGEYRELSIPTTVSLPFEFVQEDGQWRINKAEQGIILEKIRFSQVFAAHSLYFYDPTYRYLVPDLRWLPKDETLSTRIVKALVAGPAPWLAQGAVVTAFPEGTTVAPVVVESGVARVELSNQILQQTQSLQRIQYQLNESLASVTSVASVQITVNQNVVSFALGAENQPITDPRVDSRPLVYSRGQFGFFSENSVVPVAEISSKVQALVPQSVSYSAAAKVAAVVSSAGVFLVQPGSEPIVADARPNLVPPSVDFLGYLWSVPAGLPGQIQAFGKNGVSHAVTAKWNDAATITSFAVSRDGTRALAYTVTDGLTRLLVAAIIRDKDGVPLRLGDPLVLDSRAGSPIAATWVDQENIAFLCVLPNGKMSILLQQIGGISADIPSPKSATNIAGGNGLDELVLLTSLGELQRQRGNGWQTAAENITFLVAQS